MYKNIATGEIKPCKKQIENRTQGKDSLRKTFRKIREDVEEILKDKYNYIIMKDETLIMKKLK